MTQTLILLCTLAALAGLWIGDRLGALDEALQPYVDIAWKLLAILWLDRKLTRDMDAMFTCWVAAGLPLSAMEVD